MQGGQHRTAEDVQETGSTTGRARGASGQGGTGTSDPTYNLLSVAYHALQGAETVQMYIDDAKRSGDKELVKFLRQTHRKYVKAADEAKQLLAGRLAS